MLGKSPVITKPQSIPLSRLKPSEPSPPAGAEQLLEVNVGPLSIAVLLATIVFCTVIVPPSPLPRRSPAPGPAGLAASSWLRL